MGEALAAGEVRWRWLGGALDLTPEATDTTWRRLVEAYATPPRQYHTLAHVVECLEVFDRLRAEAEDPLAIELALWFHDAIYDARATDNEARSAILAIETLGELKVAPARISRVDQLVLATKHDKAPEGTDARIVTDADLAILGSEPERYDRSEQLIRQEYAWVEDKEFWTKRAAFLDGLLKRPKLFSTTTGQALFEKAARDNIKRSLKRAGHSW